ncbi:MAG: OmpA family protein [Deltaproteobacteria bacterium]|nr:OmpA family protein [Deltaproteobacteria bacterium]
MKTITLAAALLAMAACHHDKKPTTLPQPTPDKPAATEQKKPEPQVTQDQQVSPNLALAGDIVALCGIKAGATANPSFDYNKDELTPEDRTVLDQLATCMMTGALKGKAVSLIGRADPRGTEEYNLGLGSRRAESVNGYLTKLGVGQPQLAVTTRGALDATGTDEAGYAKDRRVDVQLKQD